MSGPTDEREQLRELIVEAHQTIKDLRTAIKDAFEIQRTIRASTKEDVYSTLEKAVADGLLEYQDALQKAIDKAQENVDKRFDSIVSIMLGEDKKSRRAGRESIPELIKKKIELDGR